MTIPLEIFTSKYNKFFIISVVIMFFIVSIFLFQQLKNNNASTLCFVLNEDTVSTYIILEDGEPNGSMTIIERKNGENIEPPSTGPGNLEKNAFVLADGTSLEFDSAQLVWPDGSLLAGSVFISSECPVY